MNHPVNIAIVLDKKPNSYFLQQLNIFKNGLIQNHLHLTLPFTTPDFDFFSHGPVNGRRSNWWIIVSWREMGCVSRGSESMQKKNQAKREQKSIVMK